MMNKKSLLAILGCVAMLGLVGCSDDDDSTCGDGVATGSEQCDGLDLAGSTCADEVQGSSGTLSCNLNCTFNTDGCSVVDCGNGNREFGEECDCGTVASDLPDGCTDVNGGANANCSANCEEIDLCGDGNVSGGEECDCGTLAMLGAGNLPSGCSNWNGESDSECNADCTDNQSVTCTAGVWDDCDPLVQGQCCDDDWGVELPCTALPTTGGGNACIRHCTTTNDCYWNNWCLGPQFGDLCWFAICAPDVDADIQAEMNQFCQVPGGELGFCWPIIGRQDPTDTFIGLCLEPGTIPHGDVCQMANSIDVTDRSEDMCDYGICLGASGAIEGTCAGFCDWEAAYAVAFYGAAANTEILPCAAGSNCFSESGISSDPAADDFGIRGGDLSYCRDTEATDPTNGMTTCSLVNGMLLSNPSQDCTDAGVTDGSLVGVCMDSSAGTAGVYQSCSAAADCPGGMVCVEPDVFSGNPQLGSVCVPYCDTENPDGLTQPCADAGAVPTADGTPTCQSVSDLYGLSPADVSPSRLGYCAY